jgi:hypothetical protein
MAIAFAMVSLIYFRWFTSAEPTSVFTVFGDQTASGTLIQIVRIGADNHPAGKFEIQLSDTNHYTARFFLNGGVYELVATRPDRPQPLRTSFSLPEGRAMELRLPGSVSTAPSHDSADTGPSN